MRWEKKTWIGKDREIEGGGNLCFLKVFWNTRRLNSQVPYLVRVWQVNHLLPETQNQNRPAEMKSVQSIEITQKFLRKFVHSSEIALKFLGQLQFVSLLLNIPRIQVNTRMGKGPQVVDDGGGTIGGGRWGKGLRWWTSSWVPDGEIECKQLLHCKQVCTLHKFIIRPRTVCCQRL